VQSLAQLARKDAGRRQVLKDIVSECAELAKQAIKARSEGNQPVRIAG
jgi:hypothetical protein